MIALLTDFGLDDIYVGVMKSVILRIAPGTALTDITHSIPPQNIAVGALQLAAAWDYLPDNAIVVGVVDPGVGGARRAVAARVAGKIFVGPDNGLISRLPTGREPVPVVELTEPRYRLESRRGETFHGRDVFAPAAAHLAAGVPLNQLGRAIDGESLIRLSRPNAKISDDAIVYSAPVAHIDHFGNIVLDLAADNFQGWMGSSRQFGITHEAQRWSVEAVYATRYDGAAGKLLILPNSYGLIEIATPAGSAAKLLPVGAGDRLEITRR